eukprot:CAMPEP_0185038026 /NCGR_PEP_ID=MMETSP1103-20130426/33155_1 /TAXON_ID=36769 /ORGANISM="Paraphysomonas bandaiensis, Strain Caron Lab Isolate" /LENGTH=1565 /DNA_ID=CAMNT_0027576271 /DNA_START=952 /DNA_END=5646 /DNA_ORIENTATION=+
MMHFRNVCRKVCTLIAIRPLLAGFGECQVEDSLQSKRIWRLLHRIAEHHKVTLVRKFGDVWVGCIGFFEECWDSKEVNAIHAVQMACDVLNSSEQLDIAFTCAIDHGRVVGGFVNGIFTFDVFGPEILWVLSVCEACSKRKIIVSRSTRSLINKNSLEKSFSYEPCAVLLPDGRDPERAWAVVKVANEAKCSIACNSSSYSSSPREGEDSNVLPWFMIEHVFDSDLAYNGGNLGTWTSDDTSPAAQSLAMELQYVPACIRSIIAAITAASPNVNLDHETSGRRISGSDCLDPARTDAQKAQEEGIVRALHHLMLTRVLPDTLLLFYLPDYLISSKSKSPVRCDKNESLSSLPGKTAEESDIDYVVNNSFPPPLHYEYNRVKAFIHFLRTDFVVIVRQYVLNITTFLYSRRKGRKSLDSRRVYCYEEENSDVNREGDSFVDNRGLNPENDLPPQESTFPTTGYGNSMEMNPIKSSCSRDEPIIDSSDIFRPSQDWEEFHRSCHSAHYRFLDVVMCIALSAVSIYVCVDHDNSLDFSNEITLCAHLIAPAATIWSTLVFEKREYPVAIYIMMTLLRVVAINFFPVSGKDSATKLLVYFLGWIYFSFNQRVKYFMFDVIVIALQLQHMSGVHDTAVLGGSDVIGILLGLFFFVVCFVIAEYYTFLCYIVDHILVPYEKEVYEAEREVALTVCGGYLPHTKTGISRDLLAPRCYRNCAVLAFHIKAAESIPAVADVPDVASLIDYLYKFMDGCVKKFGFLSVCHFSGIHISAICEDEEFKKLVSSSKSSVSSAPYIPRAVACVRYMQKTLMEFNTQNSMNITLGVSLSHGNALIGLNGSVCNACFDICGRARDQAFYMCARQTNRVVISSAYIEEIKRLRHVSEALYYPVDSKLPFFQGCQQWYTLQLHGGYFGACSRELKDYLYIGFLGEGGNGSVHLLRDKINRVQVAVKGIRWSMGRTSSIHHIRRELIILQQLQHPNIVNFKFCIIKRAKIYIVMEYIRGGTLRQIVEEHKPNLHDLRVWFAQLVLALGYLHHQGIMHRDVKPSNCMIDTFGHLKLTDFGLAIKDDDMTSGGSWSAVADTNHESTHPHLCQDEHTVGGALSRSTQSLMQNIFPIRENLDLDRKIKHNESILVVDSVKARLRRNVKLLKQGFTVWQANNDDEAMDLLYHRETHKVDLIILDLDTSDDRTGGWGFLSVLWEHSEWRHIPVVVMTVSHDLDFSSPCWEKRLPDIKVRPKQILSHPLNYEATKNYFEMLCRLESSWGAQQTPSKGTNSSSNKLRVLRGSVFDNRFDEVYRKYHHDHAYCDETSSPPQNKARRRLNIRGYGLVGTVQYMAPEMLAREPYDESVDWWSCGVLFFECVMRRRLFDGFGNTLLAQDILHCNIENRLESFRQLPASLKDLLLHMLDRDINNRYDEQLIKEHSFFNDPETPVEPYVVGKQYEPIGFVGKGKRPVVEKSCDGSLPGSASFDDLVSFSSQFKPQPVALNIVSDELRERQKKEFFNSGSLSDSSRNIKPKPKEGSSKGKKGKDSNTSYLPKVLEDRENSNSGDDVSLDDRENETTSAW